MLVEGRRGGRGIQGGRETDDGCDLDWDPTGKGRTLSPLKNPAECHQTVAHLKRGRGGENKSCRPGSSSQS